MSAEDLDAGREIQATLWPQMASGGTPRPAAKLAPDFYSWVAETAFGKIWSRDALPLRDRSLITVAMLAALGRTGELRGHLAGARNLGISQERAGRGADAGRRLRRGAGGERRPHRRRRGVRHHGVTASVVDGGLLREADERTVLVGPTELAGEEHHRTALRLALDDVDEAPDHRDHIARPDRRGVAVPLAAVQHPPARLDAHAEEPVATPRPLRHPRERIEVPWCDDAPPRRRGRRVGVDVGRRRARRASRSPSPSGRCR